MLDNRLAMGRRILNPQGFRKCWDMKTAVGMSVGKGAGRGNY